MKPAMSIVVTFLFLGLLTISFCYASSYQQGCIESERIALLRFQQDLEDRSDRLASWGHGNCCLWDGVVCHNMSGHVLELHLGNLPSLSIPEPYPLTGKINPSLLDLKQLIYLDLSGNAFERAQIPQFLGSMKNLKYLDLSRAGFVGMIPHELGNLSNLEYLDLSRSYIHPGDLFVENFQWLSRLSHLEHLRLSWVNLSKSFDWLQVISQLPSLEEIKLSACGLHHFPSLPLTNFSSLFTLDLSYNYFEGSIPGLLQNLTSLVHLDLSDNFFNSSIPEWLSGFRHLEDLSLQYNGLQVKFSGPLENLTSIRTLDLSGNTFEDKIPMSWGKLCSLRAISLSDSALNQEISEVLHIFSTCASNVLEWLDLTDCQVYGPLMTNQLGEFKQLHTLFLSKNSISGPLPSSLGELSSLQILQISHNKLNGTLSEAHFSNLTRLLIFDLSENSLTLEVSPHWIPPFHLLILALSSCHIGPQFPLWFGLQKDLLFLDISNSGISDKIPTYLFTFPALQFVNLSHNQLYGEIPNLSGSFNLIILDLSWNNLSGPLPLIPPLLLSLDLSKNALSGSIFHFLCYGMDLFKSQLQILILKENLLQGELPDCWMNWQNLKVLNLGSNKFTGILPDSIGTLSSLLSLRLRKNDLSGSIPASLENCTELVAFDISGNNFVGNIPAWIGENFPRMMVLNLSSNKFEGLFPVGICHLASLQILDIAHNNLSGTVPGCIGNLSAMMSGSYSEDVSIQFRFDEGLFTTYASLEEASPVMKGTTFTFTKLDRRIDLSGNFLSGKIPVEVTNLGALQSLNLSHNLFTGSIPQNIGAMRSLEAIDLSGNQLSGKLPESISTLIFLSQLNVSNNNLVGKIPTGLQGFDASGFTGNELCGPPLPNNCTATAVVPDSRNAGGEVNWFNRGMPAGFVVGFWSVIGPLLFRKRWRSAYNLFLDRLGYRISFFIRKYLQIIL